MAVEEKVLAETGPEVGGNLHIAKSRNDQVATAIRMQLRKELIEMMLRVLEMQKSLLDTASKHIRHGHFRVHSSSSSATRHICPLFAFACSRVWSVTLRDCKALMNGSIFALLAQEH